MNKNIDESELLALKRSQAAKLANVSLATIDRAISAGGLRAVKCGRATLILREDLLAWLRALPMVPVKPPLDMASLRSSQATGRALARAAAGKERKS